MSETFPTSTAARKHADFLERLDGEPRKVIRNGGRRISFGVARIIIPGAR